MSDSAGPAPSSDGGRKKSSRLDLLVKKLVNTADNSPDNSMPNSPEPMSVNSPEPSSTKDSAPRSGASRRKPARTHKVVESEDEVDFDSKATNGDATGQPEVMDTQEAAEPGEEEEMHTINIDEHGNFILEDGTMVVQPEDVDETKDDTSSESNRTRKRQRESLGIKEPLEIVVCTACNKQINPNVTGSTRRHPVLKVTICRKCYNYYTSDEIDQDSNGIDEQCRWCGEGGNLLCCDYCHNAICKGCIKRNLGRKELSRIVSAGDDKWRCYVCDLKPLNKLIKDCDKILEAIEEENKRSKEAAKDKSSKKSRDRSQSSHDRSKGKDTPRSTPKSSTKGIPADREKKVYVLPPGAYPHAPLSAKPGDLVKVTAAQANILRAKYAAQVQGRQGVPLPAQTDMEYNIHPAIVTDVLDRMHVASQSIYILVTSLRDDLRKKSKATTDISELLRLKREAAAKLKKAFVIHKKAFGDIETMVRKHGPPKPSAQKIPDLAKSGGIRDKARLEAQPVKHHVIKRKSADGEVIELLDSGDESKDSKTDKDSEGQPESKNETSTSDGKGKHNFKLRISLGGSKTKQKGSDASGSEGAEQQEEGTDSIKADTTEENSGDTTKDIKDKDDGENQEDGGEGKVDEKDAQNDKDIKEEGANKEEEESEAKLNGDIDAVDGLDVSLENGADSDTSFSARFNSTMPYPALNGDDALEDLEVIQLDGPQLDYSLTEDFPDTDSDDNENDEPTARKTKQTVTAGRKRKREDSSSETADVAADEDETASLRTSKRSRGDIEAQRVMHREMLEESSNEEENDEDEPDDVLTSSGSEEEKKKRKKRKKKNNDDDKAYNPKLDRAQRASSPKAKMSKNERDRKKKLRQKLKETKAAIKAEVKLKAAKAGELEEKKRSELDKSEDQDSDTSPPKARRKILQGSESDASDVESTSKAKDKEDDVSEEEGSETKTAEKKTSKKHSEKSAKQQSGSDGDDETEPETEDRKRTTRKKHSKSGDDADSDSSAVGKKDKESQSDEEQGGSKAKTRSKLKLRKKESPKDEKDLSEEESTSKKKK